MEFKDFTNKPFLSESFIEVYDNVVSKDLCNKMIEYFEENKELHNQGFSGGQGELYSEKDGKIYNNLNGMVVGKDDEQYLQWCEMEQKRINTVKNTTEMTLEGITQNMIQNLFTKGQLPSTEVAPFFKMYSRNIDEYITAYINKYKILGVNNKKGNELIHSVPDVKDRTVSLFPHQLQKYKKDKGHYNAWHCEWSPTPNNPSILRTLITMFYLNDVDEGGCTQFYNQNLDLQPKAGRLVLFPAYFTHTHRGQTPKSNDKYIITSMYGFRP